MARACSVRLLLFLWFWQYTILPIRNRSTTHSEGRSLEKETGPIRRLRGHHTDGTLSRIVDELAGSSSTFRKVTLELLTYIIHCVKHRASHVYQYPNLECLNFVNKYFSMTHLSFLKTTRIAMSSIGWLSWVVLFLLRFLLQREPL